MLKIISGGQTGADQGGLEGAFLCGIPTGGEAPKYYRTNIGNNPVLLKDKYKLTESPHYTYPPRTEVNVLQSDGTVWFGNVHSPGGKLTKRLTLKHHRAWIENPVNPEDLFAWRMQHGIEILNVAGNREETNPGIYAKVRDFIKGAFEGKT